MLLQVLCLFAAALQAQHLPQPVILERARANDLLPAEEINCLYQGNKGFIWVGTKNGLYRYDGYRVKRYRNTPTQPHLLVSNDVRILNQDNEGNLWVGTRKGISILNQQNVQNKEIHFHDFSNSDVINHILFTRSGDIWIGTEGGLYGQCKGRDDSLTLYCDKRQNAKVPHSSVTALLEDNKGYVWIGTWDKGLFRYNPRDRSFYEMPRFNDQNSAQALFEDANGHLWVGTWGKGLYCITNPHDTQRVLQFTHYDMYSADLSLPSNIIWNISKDPNNNFLWIGTDKGLCFAPLDEDTPQTLPEIIEPQPDFLSRGVNSIFSDRKGRMWMYAYDRGIVSACTRPSYFNIRQLTAEQKASDHISCICYDMQDRLLIGTSRSGLILPDAGNTNIPIPSRINAILPLSPDSILLGTRRDGIIVLHKGKIIRQYNQSNTPWLTDNCIYCINQDSQGRLLIGTWKGISILWPDGRGVHLEGKNIRPLETAQISSIVCDGNQSMWIGTKEQGIIHLTGNVNQPSSLRMKQYTKLLDTDFQTLNIYRLIANHRGQIWACSQEAGLMLYNPERDGFLDVATNYGIPSDDMYSIEETGNGRLWVSSRHNLISLTIDKEGKASGLRFFDRKDVINSDHFGAGFSAVSPKGQICFAGQYAYSVFNDTDIPEPSTNQQAVITNIRQYNADRTPLPDDKITLQPSERDLTIEFSSLDFDNIDGVRYAYMLDGLDREWHYTDVGVSQVSYSQLPPGTYTFRVRCTNEGGSWSREEQTLIVQVLAPLWKRWYAWLFYILTGLIIIGFIIRYLSERERHRQELQMARMECQNALNLLEEYKQKTYEKVREDLFSDICNINSSPSDEDFVRRCLVCVQRHIANSEFGLPQFADAMCMSKSTLYKKLHAATGLTTSNFIRTVRMKSACELLRQNPQARIADVAYAVGYTDPKYFSSCFKKDFGMLPSDFVHNDNTKK